MFGRRESEGKRGRKREKRRKARKLKGSRPTFIASKVILYRSSLRLIYFSEQGKLQKCMKYQNYIEGSLGKSHKKLINVGQNWTQEQDAKIHNLRNSTGCKIFATLQNFCNVPNFTTFCSIFLLTFDMQFRVRLGFFGFELP